MKVKKINKIISKLRHTSENNRIVIKNTIEAFAIKGFALIISLATMPAYLRYFNDQTALGLWFTLLSVLSWILNFDLGIGNGLRNHVAKCIANNDEAKAKKYISSAYISIGALIVVCIIGFLCLFNFINWNKVFNITSDIVSQNALNITIKIVFTGIMLQFFLKLITSILYAMQKSSLTNFLTLCTSIITLLYVLIAKPGDNDKNMIIMAIVHVAAVILPLLVANIIVFATKLKNSKPSIKSFESKYAKEVLSLGGIFFFVQVMYMIIMSTNEYLITAFSGNENVVEYQIYYKLFTLGSTIFSLALTPIWSVVTKALAEKNFDWVKKLYKRLLCLGGLGCFLEILIIPLLQVIVNIWLGKETIQINYLYAIAFAVLSGLMIMNSVLSSVANGAGELKTQAIFFGIGAIIKIPLSFILINALHSWIGVVIANAVAMAFYCIIQPFCLNKYIAKMEE